jgi:hypothetical protein
MLIPDPGSWFLPIPDPGSKNNNKSERWKKIWCHTFLCSHKFHKIVHYFSFEMLKKKNLGQFSKNYRTFYPKNCHQTLKSMYLGSGIRKKPIPDPGSRGQKGTGSRIRIRNTDRQGKKLMCSPIRWQRGPIAFRHLTFVPMRTRETVCNLRKPQSTYFY